MASVDQVVQAPAPTVVEQQLPADLDNARELGEGVPLVIEVQKPRDNVHAEN